MSEVFNAVLAGNEAELARLLATDAGRREARSLNKAMDQTPLEAAIEAKNDACAKLLLPVSKLSRSAMHEALAAAISADWPDFLQVLLDAANTRRRKSHARAAIGLAITLARSQCMSRLLPSAQLKADDQQVFFRHAATSCAVDCAMQLAPDTDPTGEALRLSVQARSVELLQRLWPISDPSALDSAGLTLLMRAAATGSAECLEWLIPRMDPTAKHRSGSDAMQLAAANGHWDCAVILASSYPLSRLREELEKKPDERKAAERAWAFLEAQELAAEACLPNMGLAAAGQHGRRRRKALSI